jgi:hypothetical protein
MSSMVFFKSGGPYQTLFSGGHQFFMHYPAGNRLQSVDFYREPVKYIIRTLQNVQEKNREY